MHFGISDVDAKADAVVSEIERQYRAGAVRLGFSADAIARYVTLAPIGALIPSISSWFTSSQEEAIQKNFQTLGDRIKTWRTTYRRWADNGKRDDGSKYTWDQWIDFGTKTIASEIQYQSGEGWNASVVVALANATAKTAEDIARKAKELFDLAEKGLPEVPSMVKWVAIAVAVAGGAYLLSPFIMAGRRAMGGYSRKRLRWGR